MPRLSSRCRPFYWPNLQRRRARPPAIFTRPGQTPIPADLFWSKFGALTVEPMNPPSRSPFVTKPAPRKSIIGRPCVGRVAMTDAERSRRYRKLAKKRRRARNVEWYTPLGIIALAVQVMGGIDVDPASCTIANEVVGAKVFHTLATNGWVASLLNPPYSKIASFVDKLIAETATGRVTEFILLTNSSTDTRWFMSAAAFATLLCFPARRIKFVSPHGLAPASPIGTTSTSEARGLLDKLGQLRPLQGLFTNAHHNGVFVNILPHYMRHPA